VADCESCIIWPGAEATSSEFWQKGKIPPPSSLDGKVGRRSPSEGLNTSGTCKLDGRNAKAVGLPRKSAKDLILLRIDNLTGENCLIASRAFQRFFFTFSVFEASEV
jgi:hypothetical protein